VHESDRRLMQDLPAIGVARITSVVGVLGVLTGVCAFFFFLEQRTKWKFFQFVPPLAFIYLVPVVLSNQGVIPTRCETYDAIRAVVLPMMLVLLLLKVDVVSAFRVTGRGILVMLFGSLGIVLGAPIACFLVRRWLSGETWKAFGALSGSWIGGTGNMAAVGEMTRIGGAELGLAVLADTTIYMLWLPILLGSKRFATAFARFTRASDRKPAEAELAVGALDVDERAPVARDYLYLVWIALGVTWAASVVAGRLPAMEPVLDAGTWRILLVTTAGIILSFTPAKRIRGSQGLAMALVYLFLACMGAGAELTGVAGQAVPFLAGALFVITFHGMFCVLGARLCRVDVHTAAIASAANIGGPASASIVAAHHKKSLVPASILMALVGYAVGNYAGFLAAQLCRLVARLP